MIACSFLMAAVQSVDSPKAKEVDRNRCDERGDTVGLIRVRIVPKERERERERRAIIRFRNTK